MKRASVLVVGAGGLGSPVCLYLAAAGIGRIGIIDSDEVDLTNLQRQVIHRTADIKRMKALSAAEKVKELNPNVCVETYSYRLTEENAEEIISDWDFVVDGVDNFSTKYLINDVCVKLGKPFCHGGLLRFEGEVMTYVPGSPCYRCLYRDEPPTELSPSSSKAGVIGAIAGIIGTLQAAEVVKYFTGVGELLTGRLLRVDALSMQFLNLRFCKVEDCQSCSKG